MGELGPAELASFEGEMRADAARERQQRWLRMGYGIAMALAGAGVAIATGTVNGLNSDQLAAGYIMGGGFGLLGAVLFGTSFIPSSAESAWAHYRRGESPHGGVSVQPVVGLTSIGLFGRF